MTGASQIVYFWFYGCLTLLGKIPFDQNAEKSTSFTLLCKFQTGTANIFIILLIQFSRISPPPKNFFEKFYVRVISMSSKFVYCLIEFFFLLNFCGNAYFPPSGNIFLLVSFNKEFYIYWETFFLLLYLSLFMSAK